MRLIINLLITAVVTYFLAHNLSGVHINDFSTAIIFAIVLGILNTIVKPIISFFSFPITILTFGFFMLVINALMVLLAGYFISGFKVDGFWWAFLFSLVLSIITTFLNSVFGINKEEY